MSAVVITRQELVEFLKSLKGATSATIVAETVPTMAKTDNPFVGKVIKRSVVNGVLNVHYANSVNRQRVREDSAPDFIPQERAWGTRIEGTPLVQHNSQYYLEVKCERAAVQYLAADGTEISKDALAPFLRERAAVNQELEKAVVLRDYKLENIKEMRVAGFNLQVKE